MSLFASQVRFPGLAPERILLVFDDEEFVLPVPPVFELLDIAASYGWERLVPQGLEEPGRTLLYEWLADPEHPASLKRLHIAVQPLGTYLYGMPFFAAARTAANLLHHFSLFRMWAALNLHTDLRGAEAADWITAATAWLLSSRHEEKERNRLWAELTTPSRLPTTVPGVLPEWMS